MIPGRKPRERKKDPRGELVKFNSPFDMKIPVERVNGHFEVRSADPKHRRLDVDLRRFDIFPDAELGLVAQRKSPALFREENVWSG